MFCVVGNAARCRDLIKQVSSLQDAVHTANTQAKDSVRRETDRADQLNRDLSLANEDKFKLESESRDLRLEVERVKADRKTAQQALELLEKRYRGEITSQRDDENSRRRASDLSSCAYISVSPGLSKLCVCGLQDKHDAEGNRKP